MRNSTDYEFEEKSNNPNILNSILARLVEFDFVLKNVRDQIHENSKDLIEIEHCRVDNLENGTIRELEDIEKLIYGKFSKLITELKETQDKYYNENSKMLNEISQLKKDKVDIQYKIREYTGRINNLQSSIGDNVFDPLDIIS